MRKYVREAAFLNTLTAPDICSILIPEIFMDIVISFYQAACFPIYKIPKVDRENIFL